MASAHIEIVSTASRTGADMRGFIGQLQQVTDDAARIKGILDQVALGSDWQALADRLGTTAADAETVYNLFGSVAVELSAPFIAQFLQRLG